METTSAHKDRNFPQPKVTPSMQGQSDSDEAMDEQPSELEDVLAHDREILEEEEKIELLSQVAPTHHNSKLVQGSWAGAPKSTRRSSRPKRKRKREKSRNHEQSELIYQLEDGEFVSSKISSQSSLSSSDLDKSAYKTERGSKLLKSPVTLRYLCLLLIIIILFVLLAFGAYHATAPSQAQSVSTFLSNGSATFAPTTILISLDGFRADFLQRGLTPTLNSFIAAGVSPKYMLPSFPSVTFPNHYTLVTGLYPESHGVVGNTFWDPALEEEFYYTDPKRSMQPKWWLGGEPIWVTAEQQNVKTAIHMWPGSEAHIKSEPTFLDKFNAHEPLSRKVDRILELLDTPNTGWNSKVVQRPQFIAAYVPVVDADGHLYGPNSTEIRKTIANVDNMLRDLFAGLDHRNLTNIVNIIIVSDHGMATTSTDRLVQLDDLIDLGLVDHIDGWPLYGLRPKNSSDTKVLYEKLVQESALNGHFQVYLRDQNMPERFHFSKNHRIAPLWVIPETGWAVVHKEDFNVKEAKLHGKTYHPKGLHGYDHEHPLMRAIFVARGPAFPHAPNSKLDVFQNIDVYNILCDSLGINPKPNNGTLRLPLSPVGLHSNDAAFVEGATNDPPLETFVGAGLSNNTTMNNSTAMNNKTELDDSKDHMQSKGSWWALFAAELEAAKAWVISMISKGSESATKNE